jgi:hypothetical protein
MKAKLPQSHLVSQSLASLEFCFASFRLETLQQQSSSLIGLKNPISDFS